jgi:hypothetical protein
MAHGTGTFPVRIMNVPQPNGLTVPAELPVVVISFTTVFPKGHVTVISNSTRKAIVVSVRLHCSSYCNRGGLRDGRIERVQEAEL